MERYNDIWACVDEQNASGTAVEWVSAGNSDGDERGGRLLKKHQKKKMHSLTA